MLFRLVVIKCCSGLYSPSWVERLDQKKCMSIRCIREPLIKTTLKAFTFCINAAVVLTLSLLREVKKRTFWHRLLLSLGKRKPSVCVPVISEPGRWKKAAKDELLTSASQKLTDFYSSFLDFKKWVTFWNKTGCDVSDGCSAFSWKLFS